MTQMSSTIWTIIGILVSNHYAIILGGETISIQTPRQGGVPVLDYRNTTLNLHLGTIYGIINHATHLPLLHDRPILNISKSTHWWTLTHVEDKIYFLQIQDNCCNSTAPRWERRVRLEKSTTPGNFYHLLPINCKKNAYLNQSNVSFFYYVDYWDEYGRSNSECVDINKDKVLNRWNVNLDGIASNKPMDPLSLKNFEYEFIPLTKSIRNVLQTGKVVTFSTNTSFEEAVMLPQLDIKKKDTPPASCREKLHVRNTISFDCKCHTDIFLDRGYFVIIIPTQPGFRVNLIESYDHQFSEGGKPLRENLPLTVEGSAHFITDKRILITQPKWTMQLFQGIIPTNEKVMSMSINPSAWSGPCSSNYFMMDNSTNGINFYWDNMISSHEVRFGNDVKQYYHCTCTLVTPSVTPSVLSMHQFILLISLTMVLCIYFTFKFVKKHPTRETFILFQTCAKPNLTSLRLPNNQDKVSNSNFQFSKEGLLLIK